MTALLKTATVFIHLPRKIKIAKLTKKTHLNDNH